MSLDNQSPTTRRRITAVRLAGLAIFGLAACQLAPVGEGNTLWPHPWRPSYRIVADPGVATLLVARYDDHEPVLHINPTRVAETSRHGFSFIAAHEYGHYVLGHIHAHTESAAPSPPARYSAVQEQQADCYALTLLRRRDRDAAHALDQWTPAEAATIGKLMHSVPDYDRPKGFEHCQRHRS